MFVSSERTRCFAKQMAECRFRPRNTSEEEEKCVASAIPRHGSGFYCKVTVGGSVLYGLITNNHVLKSRDACKAANAFFLYEKSGTGLRVKLKPEKLFMTHPVSLKKESLGCNLVLYLKLLLNLPMKEPEEYLKLLC
ncbi:PREDICTED: uncharacterized protein LOC107328776 isoform X2 [Acropora digitifera]|uniref:uncharacterized protein LOC107328776 isoform X2 n=1 Tax=Acropora digitifera TaxID=70779 RepID=UPI00077A5642|nr:PREDICTED: uncharacterized protein LOC107328776 isoform X2 [Acropora digitifera]